MSLRSVPKAVVDQEASDDDLVQACLAGDEQAWAAMLGRYGAYVYAVAVRAYRLEPQAADEVFQDVCVRLYDGLAGYRGSGGFKPWVRQVTISACRDHFRRLSRHERGQPLDGYDPPEAEMADLDAALDVRGAVARLKDPCRTTIEYAFFLDLTQAETAKRLGVPEGTVAARISRCLRRLRDDLQENPAPAASKEQR